MKKHSYPLFAKVRVNDKAQNYMPMDIGLEGFVRELLTNSLYDYEVSLADGTKGRFKEKELDLIEVEESDNI